MRLGALLDQATGAGHDGVLDGDAVVLDIDCRPAETDQLGSPRTGGSGHQDEHSEIGLRLPGGEEDPAKLSRGRHRRRALRDLGRRRRGGGIGADPLPADALLQRSTQDAVGSPHRSGGQRVDPPPTSPGRSR